MKTIIDQINVVLAKVEKAIEVRDNRLSERDSEKDENQSEALQELQAALEDARDMFEANWEAC